MGFPKIFHDNRFDDATPAASTTATGYDVLNLLDWRPYTKWQPTALPATVTVDSGSALAADYALCWEHDLATQGATFEVRGSTDNFAASNVLLATKTPTTDDPFLLEWATSNYRYRRITITGTTVPTLGIAAIGAALEIPQYLREGFDPRGRKPMGVFNKSVAGMPLGRTVQYEEWSQSLTFELLTWAWIRATWEPAWEAHLRGEPFVFAWDSVSHATELVLVTVKDGFQTPHKQGSIGNLTLNLVGLLA